MRQLIFATNNQHKLKEIRALLQKEFKILSLEDIHFDDEIPEDYFTLEENACAKAMFIFKKFGIDCFADDTGLEVNALNGGPGVHSARYAGKDKDPINNMNKLLNNLKGYTDRTAQFKTVIGLIEKGETYIFDGIVRGIIIDTPRGNKGFGYDPVFRPEGYPITFAEMELEEKNKISHRALAFNRLAAHLRKKTV